MTDRIDIRRGKMAKPVEKHLFLISTKVNGIREITVEDKGRWDVPNEISYSKLQMVLDSLCSGEPMGPQVTGETCEDVSTNNGIFKCSKCGCTVEEDGVDWGGIHYCPDCGKRVDA